MKKVKKEYEVYNFNELSEESKNQAINDTIKFFIECFDYENLSDNMKKAINEAEKMRTPWFIGEYIWEYAKEEILENCRQYEYLKNGIIFNE